MAVTFEPTEVTYRSIMYYLDENMVKMVTPGSGNDAAASCSSCRSANTTGPKPVPNRTSRRITSATTRRPDYCSRTYLQLRPQRPSSLLVQLKSKTPAVSPDTASSARETRLEPPPSPGPKPILKPVSGGVLNGTAISAAAADLSGSRETNENFGCGYGRSDSRRNRQSSFSKCVPVVQRYCVTQPFKRL